MGKNFAFSNLKWICSIGSTVQITKDCKQLAWDSQQWLRKSRCKFEIFCDLKYWNRRNFTCISRILSKRLLMKERLPDESMTFTNTHNSLVLHNSIQENFSLCTVQNSHSIVKRKSSLLRNSTKIFWMELELSASFSLTSALSQGLRLLVRLVNYTAYTINHEYQGTLRYHAEFYQNTM